MQLSNTPEKSSVGAGEEAGLTTLKQFRLGLSRQYYAMASVLGLKRVQDYFQESAPLAPAGAVCILGQRYANSHTSEDEDLEKQVSSQIALDISSRLWLTYRRGFPPLGPSGLTSDVGWGCALRSGQMLLAQVLLQQLHGRQWRRPAAASPVQPEIAELLSWFWDSPGPEHPFSIHNLVQAGRAHGITAGEWLGPWTLCHTLQEVVNRARPSRLRVHVANTPGGGAPVLYTDTAQQAFESSCHGQEGGSLLLLVPLVLGIGNVNPVYVPQLQAVLEWPQSAGIVGGRPSSSLYFIGYQGSRIIFLDPHTVQEVGSAPADVSGTYFCDEPRAMPVGSIDPSLAIGFHCQSSESFADLMARLRALEQKAGGAPLLNVVAGEPPPPFPERQSSMAEGGGGEEQWELL